ncbi:SET domain-containing protein [Rhodopseudomonas sp. HC1]|uniref:SET domain-containing protein n=1 Tax=Rhodopseudomonas infernalis TaxID=2897386 RepID=UPI001EE8C9F2|nr:SET domain-containing protein [Rhodopseudomonas infernalis]MCG6204556.1 SET domain-containing protein [Rhodopseudomonas infernalis]
MPDPSSKPYRVGRSKTGLGLFATEPIKKGTKIIRYFGPMLDCNKKKDDAVENKYLFQISKRWTVDGSVRKNIARYINHSCKPNAESDVSVRKRKIMIRAIKNIEPGEEINYDYGTEYFKEYLKPIGCKCDACEKKRLKKAAEARAEKKQDKQKAKGKADKSKDKEAAKSKAKAGKPKAEKVKADKVKSSKADMKSAKAKSAKAGAKASKAKASKTQPKSAKPKSGKAAA